MTQSPCWDYIRWHLQGYGSDVVVPPACIRAEACQTTKQVSIRVECTKIRMWDKDVTGWIGLHDTTSGNLPWTMQLDSHPNDTKTGDKKDLYWSRQNEHFHSLTTILAIEVSKDQYGVKMWFPLTSWSQMALVRSLSRSLFFATGRSRELWDENPDTRKSPKKITWWER